jgi:hypothetical protein
MLRILIASASTEAGLGVISMPGARGPPLQLRCQELIGDQESADGGSRVAPASSDDGVHDGLQIVTARRLSPLPVRSPCSPSH